MRDEVRTYLESVRWLRMEQQRLRLKIDELETQATKITSSITGMPGGGGSDVQKLWTLIADEHHNAVELQRKLFHREHEVEEFVNRISNPTYREILKLRYLSCYTWDEVATKLSEAQIYYSDRHLKRLHGYALNAAREQWNKEHQTQS